jgi:adenosine/AMP kinase
MAAISLEAVPIDKPNDTNVLIGLAHSIKKQSRTD